GAANARNVAHPVTTSQLGRAARNRFRPAASPPKARTTTAGAASGTVSGRQVKSWVATTNSANPTGTSNGPESRTPANESISSPQPRQNTVARAGKSSQA